MTRNSHAFCDRYGLKMPVLLAPMAGACPVGLSIAVANAGSMGAMGALMHTAPRHSRPGCASSARGAAGRCK